MLTLGVAEINDSEAVRVSMAPDACRPILPPSVDQ